MTTVWQQIDGKRNWKKIFNSHSFIHDDALSIYTDISAILKNKDFSTISSTLSHKKNRKLVTGGAGLASCLVTELYAGDNTYSSSDGTNVSVGDGWNWSPGATRDS